VKVDKQQREVILKQLEQQFASLTTQIASKEKRMEEVEKENAQMAKEKEEVKSMLSQQQIEQMNTPQQVQRKSMDVN
jgi:regulator of replication initiation timing